MSKVDWFMFSKKNCPQCLTTKIWLKKNGIDYVEHESEKILKQVAVKYGHMQAPVVVVHEDGVFAESWSGFKDDKITEWVKKARE